jgi:hypothetical protein
MLGVIYPLVEQMTENRELLLFRNSFAFGEHDGIQ